MADGGGSDLVTRVVARLHDALAAGHAAGRRAFGDLGLPLDAYAVEVVAGLEARFVRLGVAVDDETLAAAVRRSALEDLYLARALERGSAEAWTLLERRFRGRLVGLVTRRGGRGPDPEAIATELLSELALPPPRRNARTLAGTYDGSGSLWGWLAATAVRRLGRHHERGGLEACAAGVTATTPLQELVEGETAAALEHALRAAWALLGADERLVLQWRHGQGLPQRRIATLLGVAEYQVSRLRTAAIRKIRGAVERAVQLPPAVADSLWARLELVVSRQLASSEPRRAPASEETG